MQYPSANIGVIVNTVTKAQHLGSLLDDSVVFHSRFKSKDRICIADKIMAGLGKNRTPDALGTTGSVVVATQVLEQSMDLDFDILLTELSPMPSFLQRTGRLWRHDRTRPEGLVRPLCFVLQTEIDAPTKYSYLPYSPPEVQRAKQLLQGREVLHFPEDIGGLTEESLVTAADLAKSKLGLDTLVTWGSVENHAKTYLIPSPVRLKVEGELLNWASLQDVDSGKEQYLTRWSGDSVSATVVLCETPAIFDAVVQGVFPVKAALRVSVPVSGKLAQLVLKQAGDPEELNVVSLFDKKGMLYGYIAINESTWTVGAYDERTGLRICS